MLLYDDYISIRDRKVENFGRVLKTYGKRDRLHEEQSLLLKSAVKFRHSRHFVQWKQNHILFKVRQEEHFQYIRPFAFWTCCPPL